MNELQERAHTLKLQRLAGPLGRDRRGGLAAPDDRLGRAGESPPGTRAPDAPSPARHLQTAGGFRTPRSHSSASFVSLHGLSSCASTSSGTSATTPDTPICCLRSRRHEQKSILIYVIWNTIPGRGTGRVLRKEVEAGKKDLAVGRAVA